MKIKSLLLALLSAVAADAQTYITHADVLDVNGEKILRDYTIVIRDGKIEQVAPSSKVKPAKGAEVIDAKGKWVMPGMVDAHVHFFQTGGIHTRPDAIDLRAYKPYEEELAWYKENLDDQLRRYLSCGITTVIDDGATLELLRQRDTFRTRHYTPRILMAGPLISTNYMPRSFEVLDEHNAPFYNVTTPEEAVAMTQKQYPYAPDFIKIWYIVRNNDKIADAQRNLPLVQATIREAKQNGYKVAVHAPQKIAARMAVEAGADHLVHSVDDEVVDADFIRLLKKNKVALCPTLTVRSGYTTTQKQTRRPDDLDLALANPEQLGTLDALTWLGDTALAGKYRRSALEREPGFRAGDSISRVNLKKLYDAGVVIAAGTDAGNIGTLHAASFLKELMAMRDAGLTNWQVLKTATVNGAKVFGKENEFGSIAKGRSADLVILDANPVEDLQHLRKVNLVVNRGVCFRPDTLVRETPLMLAQRQLNAYNAHNLEAFLYAYSDDVEVYNFPDELVFKGKEEMRKKYAFLNNAPGLHAEIKKRIVVGNMVIDHERATLPGRGPVEVIAMYVIENNKISKVYFKR
jgi:imidazolonepropionase-like amidohydrolase